MYIGIGNFGYVKLPTISSLLERSLHPSYKTYYQIGRAHV